MRPYGLRFSVRFCVVRYVVSCEGTQEDSDASTYTDDVNIQGALEAVGESTADFGTGPVLCSVEHDFQPIVASVK